MFSLDMGHGLPFCADVIYSSVNKKKTSVVVQDDQHDQAPAVPPKGI